MTRVSWSVADAATVADIDKVRQQTIGVKKKRQVYLCAAACARAVPWAEPCAGEGGSTTNWKRARADYARSAPSGVHPILWVRLIRRVARGRGDALGGRVWG